MPAAATPAGTSILIVACRTPRCRKAGAVDAVRDDFGWREWTAAFTRDARGRYVPDSPDATNCPDCGKTGVIYDY